MSAVIILGASALQRPLIAAARATGRPVVTVDNVPTNPGHREADRSHCVSTRDVEGVIAIARQERASAVLTACSDVALPAAAAATRALGLVGFDPDLLSHWFPKNRIRLFQRAKGLPHPAFVTGPASPTLLADARKLGGDVVVKPTDRSGSRGVTRIADVRDPALGEAVQRAAEISFSGEVIVEHYVAGEEIGGDAWIRGGRPETLFVTRKDMQGAIVRGHRRPASLPAAQEAALFETIDQHVRQAGYRDGPLNFDVRMTPEGLPVVLELAPRLGGNWIPQLVDFSSGVDLFGAVVRQALGEDVSIPNRSEPTAIRPAASFVIGSSKSAALREAIPVERLREALPALVALEIDLAPGDRVEAFRDSAQQVGRALFDLACTDYETAADALEQALAPWLAPTRSRGARAGRSATQAEALR